MNTVLWKREKFISMNYPNPVGPEKYSESHSSSVSVVSVLSGSGSLSEMEALLGMFW